MSEASVREFMSRVMPWPQGHGYVNLHWRTPNPRDTNKDFWHGKPVQTIPDFLGILSWVQRQPQTRDIYFCLSTQAKTSKNKRGNVIAVRNQNNVVLLKSIWLDIDIKEPPKGYATLEEAATALEDFCKAFKLPSPSALVGSGGGLHVYWISNKPLTLQEWQGYATGLRKSVTEFGLRCDAMCTIDAARVLRVPETYNFKTVPPRPVKLLAIKDQSKDYDFAERFGHIKQTTPVPAAVKPAFDLSNFPKRDEKVESLSEGIERFADKPLAWEPLIRGCAFVRTALETKGKDYSQPMWNLTTLLATFMEDGHDFAHYMARGHSGYDNGGPTEVLWNRKLKERHDRGLGWPSCGAIQAAGCTACAVCPHLSKGKSPLNLTAPNYTPPDNKPVASPAQHGAPDEYPFPVEDGYALNDDGEPCFVGPKGNPISIFRNKIDTTRLPWTEANPDVLHFYAFTQGKTDVSDHIEMKLTEIQSLECGPKLSDQSIKINLKARMENFLVSWMAKLEKLRKAQQNVPFGWIREETAAGGDKAAGAKIGFSYGGTAIHKGGEKATSGYQKPRIREWYSPIGSAQPWYDGCKLITDQKRPELDAIIASSFGTPLVNVQGQSGIVFSAHGIGSGQGKSSSATLGMAIWGHPKKTKAVPTSTLRMILEQMGEINNLPVFWDEVKDDDTRKRLYDVVYNLTEGVSGGKLTQTSEIRDRGTWSTSLITCSNQSLIDYITRKQKKTSSAHYRVLEWHVPEILNGVGKIASEQAAGRIFDSLDYNYGSVGLRYSELLGSDPDRVERLSKEWGEKFHKAIIARSPERFWVGGCAAILTGAQLATEIGVAFDVDRMFDFLRNVVQENRERIVKESMQAGTDTSSLDILVMYFKDRIAETLHTLNLVTRAGGRPKIDVLSGPARGGSNPRPVNVHWGVEDRICRISRNDFRDWLAEKELGYHGTIQGLKQHFNVNDDVSATLGGGTVYGVGIERVLEIPIDPEGPLAEWMNAYQKKATVEALTA